MWLTHEQHTHNTCHSTQQFNVLYLFLYFSFTTQKWNWKDWSYPQPIYNTWQAGRGTQTRGRALYHRDFKAEPKSSALSLQKHEELKGLRAAFLIRWVQTAALLHFCSFHKNLGFSWTQAETRPGHCLQPHVRAISVLVLASLKEYYISNAVFFSPSRSAVSYNYFICTLFHNCIRHNKCRFNLVIFSMLVR